MGLAQLLVLGLCAILLGLLIPQHLESRRRWLGAAALLVSIAAAFWLQPSSPLRNMDFWLPMLSLALTAFVWAATRPPGSPKEPAGLLLAAVPVVLIALTRYLGPLCCLTASRPPAVLPVLVALLAAAAVIGLPLRFPAYNRFFSWMALLALLSIFVVLKTPALTAGASTALRALTGQSTELAAPSDLTWLGFSFLAFRLIHVLRDFQTGKLPELSFIQFAAYGLFFPTYVAGPIDRVQRWTNDLAGSTAPAGMGMGDAEGSADASVQLADVAAGAQRILVGVFKKFALADSLALFALNPQNAEQTTSSGWMWVLLLGYTLRIYLDFSGYTDVAIGLGRLMGFHLPENFDRPYLKSNLTSFWNSWHITLALWFRAYVFNPLLRFLRVRPRKLPTGMMILISQVVTMGLIGLWHGVTWNFLIWGVWHGLGLFIHNRWADWVRPKLDGLEARPTRLLQLGGWALTFLFVSLGWVWFALPDFDLALHVFERLFGQ